MECHLLSKIEVIVCLLDSHSNALQRLKSNEQTCNGVQVVHRYAGKVCEGLS
jgi:hypothetical protein